MKIRAKCFEYFALQLLQQWDTKLSNAPRLHFSFKKLISNAPRLNFSFKKLKETVHLHNM